MNYIDNYKDLCTDIDIQQCIIEDIENEMTNLRELTMDGPKEILKTVAESIISQINPTAVILKEKWLSL